MKALGMVEIDGNWRMPDPVEVPDTVEQAAG